jgi:glutamate formiminotransferase/formiminotetrahydrofolate cyclodeaminase
MKQIIECVPNFSEGRNMKVIDSIAESIRQSGGVKVLNVDPGAATNRTVITFAGSPEDVTEAAFQGVKRAGELIDMRQHHGAHPRLGATDVLPLVPVSGITVEECAELARTLAERIYMELGIPCYCYEAAAFKPERKNLAVCRAGEYEALPERMKDPVRRPDFGPGEFTERAARTGATNVGARDFLIAVNFNLNTTSVSEANAIAFEVREKGRPETVDGKTVMIPGTLKGCKAIGWFIDEYGIAQVSMNITDINTTPLHIAFEEVCRAAQARGLQVTGTEIIGLVPKRTMLEAGLYFLERQQRPTDVSEQDIMQAAVISMGLDDLKPFNVKDKVVELLIGD